MTSLKQGRESVRESVRESDRDDHGCDQSEKNSDHEIHENRERVRKNTIIMNPSAVNFGGPALQKVGKSSF